ncbi:MULTISPECIES: C4-dicarboxylate TRAP transporter substrate-binding protein [unclassified Shinella]|uniref:C4-dicarboxylate TRAP transporter substrate-binding protein n=1 Tax=unclassified Shinella TaxID=2643062 RepID=UPI00225C7955|nr:C4-dicarboxylate TRAP transporter substrate-binding protein [Shinella sp. YE25]MDC7259642.1 C4-dicarboxylate TRAP transporter substrate-binding protein [Shinella sp. YE25]CAI0334237.1 TRAP-type C4-dicarboxylate transport system, periplasmic component [Rhizobiaceae bacterium]CAK7261892.1 TRAP-type C4-dicarboxylate transport system periplasmic component-like protein [Shinella sp. WSC3-e]
MRLVVAFLAAMATSPAWADTISATVVAGHPEVFRWVKMFPVAFEPAVEKALEGTGHQISLTNQFGGSIAGVGEELETVEDGLAEIGIIQSLFDPAKMPLQNVTYYTPFVSPDPRTVNELMNELVLTDPRLQAAFTQHNIVPLGGPLAVDDYLLLTTFPVKSIEDLKGRKIATAGAAVSWLDGTSAVGVSGQSPLYYNDIKTGVYEGVILFATAALPAKLHEVAPYITRVGFGAQYAGTIGANAEWFQSQPTEVQEALREGAKVAGEWYLRSLEQGTDAALAKMAAEGATITVAPEDMRKAWAAGMKNIAKEWAKKADSSGLPGSEVLTLYMERMRSAGVKPLRDWDKE